MIPLWVIPLLGTSDTEEFLYSDRYMVHIKGKFADNEWIVDIHVSAMPYFAWGCNKFHTSISGSFKVVVRYYLTLVLNQLSELNADGRKGILSAIKDNLE